MLTVFIISLVIGTISFLIAWPKGDSYNETSRKSQIDVSFITLIIMFGLSFICGMSIYDNAPAKSVTKDVVYYLPEEPVIDHFNTKYVNEDSYDRDVSYISFFIKKDDHVERIKLNSEYVKVYIIDESYEQRLEFVDIICLNYKGEEVRNFRKDYKLFIHRLK